MKEGTFTFVDASSYKGSYKVDGDGARTRCGQGTLVQGPEVSEGTWLDDALHGPGKVTFATGAVYEGAFSQGRFAGEGSYSWPDGARYVGSWRDGKFHGKGCYTDAEAVNWAGQYHNGKYYNGKAYATLR
ncbi:hypothetical protein M885DRAFT_432434 [Pelagophyceae sp. CCMP2097]|nr:hypothetical protein M885DRAFT_432434 [Pelagophyceae sp. CCMP2097]